MSETNGTAGPITVEPPARVEAGLMAVQEVEQERDGCQRRSMPRLQTDHRGLKAEHDALRIAYERAQSDITTWRQDRDEAVTKLAAFEAVFNAVLSVMQKHRGATLSDNAAIPEG